MDLIYCTTRLMVYTFSAQLNTVSIKCRLCVNTSALQNRLLYCQCRLLQLQSGYYIWYLIFVWPRPRSLERTKHTGSKKEKRKSEKKGAKWALVKQWTVYLQDMNNDWKFGTSFPSYWKGNQLAGNVQCLDGFGELASPVVDLPDAVMKP